MKQRLSVTIATAFLLVFTALHANAQIPPNDPTPARPAAETPVPADARHYHDPVLGISLGSDPQDRGVLVVDVTKDSPAAKAGLAGGDVILSVDNKRVAQVGEIKDLVALQPVGEDFAVQIFRNGRTQQVMLQTMPRRQVFPPKPEETAWLGILLSDDDQPGVLVGDVYPAGPAADAGIRSGDRILSIGNEDVETVQQLAAEIAKREPGNRAQVMIMRGAIQIESDVEFGDRNEYFAMTARYPVLPADDVDRDDDDAAEVPEDADPYDVVTDHAMHIEGFRRLCEQNERLERITLDLLKEVRQLRAEVRTLRADD